MAMKFEIINNVKIEALFVFRKRGDSQIDLKLVKFPKLLMKLLRYKKNNLKLFLNQIKAVYL